MNKLTQETKESIQTFELKTTSKNEVIFSEKEKTLYNENKSKLKELYNSIEKDFLNMAFLLYPIYKNELYKIEGYSNIYDFARENLELSRGTCCEFIQICENLCTKSNNKCITGLKKNYTDYSISKLRILASIDRKEHKYFSPDMTVREMKLKKKELSSKLLNKFDNTEKETVRGEVEPTISSIFDREFDSYDELLALKDDFSQAWTNIKTRMPNAKLKIVIEGI